MLSSPCSTSCGRSPSATRCRRPSSRRGTGGKTCRPRRVRATSARRRHRAPSSEASPSWHREDPVEGTHIDGRGSVRDPFWYGTDGRGSARSAIGASSRPYCSEWSVPRQRSQQHDQVAASVRRCSIESMSSGCEAFTNPSDPLGGEVASAARRRSCHSACQSTWWHSSIRGNTSQHGV